MTVPVAIFTADHRHAELRVMLYFYAKYWNWPAKVFGFRKPGFALEDNVDFISLGDMKDYPANKWSDGIIKAIDEHIRTPQFILLLEDYWLTRRVDTDAVDWLAYYMSQHPDIVRGDLTTDRLYAGNLREVEPCGHLDIIENDPPADYHFSTQAAIWNTKELRKLLVSGETPWQTELEGTNRMKFRHSQGFPSRVVGTRQCPVRYLIAVQHGKLTLDGGYQKPAPAMLKADVDTAVEMLAGYKETFAFTGEAK